MKDDWNRYPLTLQYVVADPLHHAINFHVNGNMVMVQKSENEFELRLN